MLLQSKYMQHTEAVLTNPILFGDYRTAKSVSLLTLCCSTLLVIVAGPAYSFEAVCATTQPSAERQNAGKPSMQFRNIHL